MHRRELVRSVACALVSLAAMSAAVLGQARTAGSPTTGQTEEVVLFPFDDRSIPFSYGLSYNLVQGRRRGVVLRPAESGPDSQHIINHGSVLRIDGEFRIWYLCSGDHDPLIRDPDFEAAPPTLDDNYNPRNVDDERIYHVCYAVSQDGLHWDRPALGLVDYGGNKQNNLLAFDLGQYRVTNLRIIRDPEEPDPQRRFKMAFQSEKYRSRLAMASSPDGLDWKEMPGNPHNTVMLEISGFTKFNGAYYLNGHGGSPRPGPAAHAPRRMVTYVSYDFEHWAAATALSFERELGEVPVPWRGNAGEQIHTGAALWNRGNVVIGFYGMWHGDQSDDRRMVAMDLGLIVSDDAIHFKEPITDFRIVPGNEEGETQTPGYNPRTGAKGGGSFYGALMQGQGWENVGDHTLYWYNVWTQGRVRLATWARDRLGYFEIVPNPGSKLQESAHFISYPITLTGPDQKVFVNADGLSDQTYLTVEVYDDQLRPVSGYSGEAAAPIKVSGFRQAAEWGRKTTLSASDRPIRVRVNFMGVRPEDIRVYAVYVAEQ